MVTACSNLSLSYCCADLNLRVRFSHCTADRQFLCHTSSSSLSTLTLPHLSAEVKHSILLEYIPHSTTHSFAALARRHDVAGGGEVVRRWHQRWNRTPHSLERREGSGATPILTPSEISRHIRAPILAANRSHRAVSYTKLLPDVRRKTRKAISLRTVRRYGRERLGIKLKHTQKRTRQECE